MKVTCAWMYIIGKYSLHPNLNEILRGILEIKEMGFEYLEMEGVGYKNLNTIINNKKKIKKIIDERNLKISNFAILLSDIISMDEKIKKNALYFFEKGVETAKYLNSQFIWMDSYFPPIQVLEGKLAIDELVYGQNLKVRISNLFKWDVFWNNFVDSIIKCNEIARKHNIKMLLEPRVGEVISNTEGLLRLIDFVKDENFGVVFDIAHLHAQKEILPLSIEKLGKHIMYVHVADNDGRDNRHYEPGKGTVDWDEIFMRLKNLNYKSFFAIDLEKMSNLKEKFLFTKEFLQNYANKYSL